MLTHLWSSGGGRSIRPTNRQAQLGTASQPGERITLDATDAARRGVQNAVANYSGYAKVSLGLTEARVLSCKLGQSLYQFSVVSAQFLMGTMAHQPS